MKFVLDSIEGLKEIRKTRNRSAHPKTGQSEVTKVVKRCKLALQTLVPGPVSMINIFFALLL